MAIDGLRPGITVAGQRSVDRGRWIMIDNDDQRITADRSRSMDDDQRMMIDG